MIDISTYLSGKDKICVIGLGYVGLPLAVLFAEKYSVIGFDINSGRIAELKSGHDRTGEVDSEKLSESAVEFTDDASRIRDAKLIIVTVPTPINEHLQPELTPVTKATETLAANLEKGSVIVYESTVYPGVTEEICAPLIERISGYEWKKDFHLGYSPERVNPGDKERTIDKIIKVVSADNENICSFLAEIYGGVITAGIFRAASIKTAEAAKVIENTQRDLNIALINELSKIFSLMDIDTRSVLEAAGTKWNFLKFEPGLVGGHCIGVDPYYLTYKAQELGYEPQVILAGRNVNSNMGKYVAEKTVKKIIQSGVQVKGSRALILGLTFKVNCPDIRNTKVIDIYTELKEYGMVVDVYDPAADSNEVLSEYGITMQAGVENSEGYDAVIVAVKHKEFADYAHSGILERMLSENGILVDIKGQYPKDIIGNTDRYWRL